LTITKTKTKPKIIVPIRYIGGKTKAINKILKQHIPENYTDFREPFIGGGSVSLYYSQLHPERNYWINDINKNLITFWKTLQEQPDDLVERIFYYRDNYLTYDEGYELRDITQTNLKSKNTDDFTKAVSYFIMNRCSYMGMEYSYADSAFRTNFTPNNIEKLLKIAEIIKNWKITNYDYSELYKDTTDNTFIYNDPPYLLPKGKNKLYGNKGEFHKNFNHDDFQNNISNTICRWMISYNIEMKDRYKDFNTIEWTQFYGMSNK